MEEARQRGRPRKPRPPGLSGQLGQAIEQHRKIQDLSADDLSELAGLGLGTIIRIERGEQSSTLETVLAIAHALGKSGAELLAECADWIEQPKRKEKRHAPPRE